jgi:hypothetical protein
MKLSTHIPDGERRKPIDIEVCRSKVRSQLLRILHFVLKISCGNKKSIKFFVLFVLRSSISIGFLLSPPGMCVQDRNVGSK